jgi:ornithine cyclodeaminase
MRVITAEEIDAALSPRAMADALAEAFRGSLTAPPRHHHTVPRPVADATMLLMPAWTAAGHDKAVMGVKIVTVFPDNATRSLPSVLGSYILMDGASGAPVAVMDGARLTLWRTAGASALAARHLARKSRRRMLMVGAGALCPFLIRAHAAEANLSDIAIWNHNSARSQAQADLLGAEGLPVRVATSLEAEARAADLISCATLSPSPLIRGEWLAPGCHVDLVGAFNMAMREVDDAALARGSLFVDTPAALVEGGDIAIAVRDGAISAEKVQGDLARLCCGEIVGRGGDDEITLFKSIGASIEDLAAAQLVWSKLNG